MSRTCQKQPPEVFCKTGVLRNLETSQETTRARASFLIKLLFYSKEALRNFAKFTGKHPYQSLLSQASACNFINKETLTQVFSCEFCEISTNTSSYRTLPVAASGVSE